MAEHRLDALTYYAYVDPASCRSKAELKGLTARSAVVVVGADQARRIFVVHAWASRCATEELVEEIFRVHERWAPVFGIEGAFMQALFADTVGLLARERGIQLNSHAVDLPRGIDKVARIRGILQPAFAAGRVILHPASQFDLVQELNAFPRGRTVDLVDALSQAVLLVPHQALVAEQTEQRESYRTMLEQEGLPSRLIAEALAERAMTRREAPAAVERVPARAPDGRELDPFERKIAAMRAKRRRARVAEG